MLCGKPITLATGQRVGCGQCLNCDINKRRGWVCRVLLEGMAAEKSNAQVSWVTLTYSDENIPRAARGAGHFDNTLRPKDIQLLHKKLRRKEYLGSFRFFLVGEYGDETLRPHYHALYFGPDVNQVVWSLEQTWEKQFGHTRTRPWRQGERGDEDVASIRASYVANYVTKKRNQVDSKKLTPNQIPEFTQMSRAPGIGVSRHLLDLATTYGGATHISETGDVPRSVRIGKRTWPLDKTLLFHLREQLGVPHLQADRAAINPAAWQRDGVAPTAEDYYHARQSMKILEHKHRRSRGQTETL